MGKYSGKDLLAAAVFGYWVGVLFMAIWAG